MAVHFRLRELLADRQKADPSLNQSQLAARSGVSFATINRLCTNATERVDLGVIDKLCRALEVQPGDLFAYRKGKRT